MANPSDKQMLRDANGDLIPQFWDITAGDFKPLTGSDGAQDTRLTGSIVEETLINEIIGGGSFLQSNKFSINNSKELRFIVESPSGYDDYHVFYVDESPFGATRHPAELNGVTRIKSFTHKPHAKSFRIRIDNTGDVEALFRVSVTYIDSLGVD